MANSSPQHNNTFVSLPDRIREHARHWPHKLAIADGDAQLTYVELDGLLDRFAATLRHHGIAPRQVVASAASAGVAQAIFFLGALRAGCVAALIQPSATPEQIAGMIADSGAVLAFVDAATGAALAGRSLASPTVLLDDLDNWLAPAGTPPAPAAIQPQDGFNIIYSSGTTGAPKGIVHTHAMRWQQYLSSAVLDFANAVTLLATPLYSNTTLTALLPTLGWGGSVVLMKKFDAHRYVELAQQHRATHTMLVPIQYQRIMALPDFAAFDLSSFRYKTCTSAPFKAELKGDVIRRWPGALIELYGMTEGGGTAVLFASEFPDKLHTVGQPLPGSDIRLVDDAGREVPRGEIGEIVSRSDAMMEGYHGREQATVDATWISPEGKRFIRHGDIGRFDDDGFLVLVDRKKDMIISGGFNIYPSDIEVVLARHPAVADCTVIGVPSEQWGETPVGFYVPGKGKRGAAATILKETNTQLGKTQRLAALYAIDELPRSAIGKVLKRDLRDRLAAGEFANNPNGMKT